MQHDHPGFHRGLWRDPGGGRVTDNAAPAQHGLQMHPRLLPQPNTGDELFGARKVHASAQVTPSMRAHMKAVRDAQPDHGSEPRRARCVEQSSSPLCVPPTVSMHDRPELGVLAQWGSPTALLLARTPPPRLSAAGASASARAGTGRSSAHTPGGESMALRVVAAPGSGAADPSFTPELLQHHASAARFSQCASTPVCKGLFLIVSRFSPWRLTMPCAWHSRCSASI
jgi:hypothetical protein